MHIILNTVYDREYAKFNNLKKQQLFIKLNNLNIYKTRSIPRVMPAVYTEQSAMHAWQTSWLDLPSKYQEINIYQFQHPAMSHNNAAVSGHIKIKWLLWRCTVLILELPRFQVLSRCLCNSWFWIILSEMVMCYTVVDLDANAQFPWWTTEN